MKKIILNWRPLLAALAILAISACQSLPAAPEHKYYRLLAAPAGTEKQTLNLSGELAVRPLRAEGLYNERAIIFTDEQQRQLAQYHYHHWLYPPAQLIQEHLAERLRQAGIAPTVRLQEHGADIPNVISGRIVRFEKTNIPGQAKASVALELHFEKNGKMLWQKIYGASETVPDNTMVAFSAAMEVALNRIYREFLGDLGRIKLE